MPIRSWLQLYRGRLIFAAGLSVFFALFMLFWTTAESPTDFGILWHHFCGCPPDPSDTFAILNLPTFACTAIGLLLGVGVGAGVGTNVASTPGATDLFFGPTRFLLTRPTPRYNILLAPILLALAAIALLPAAGLLLLLGWLRLVHAPALGHMLDLVRLIPGASTLAPHPGLAAVIAASHFVPHYIAAISVGLCAYALFYTQRWTVLSKRRWVRLASSFPLFVFILPSLRIFSRRIGAAIFLTPPRREDLGYVPSPTAIALHLAFAAVLLIACWTIARDAEV